MLYYAFAVQSNPSICNYFPSSLETDCLIAFWCFGLVFAFLIDFMKFYHGSKVWILGVVDIVIADFEVCFINKRNRPTFSSNLYFKSLKNYHRFLGQVIPIEFGIERICEFVLNIRVFGR